MTYPQDTAIALAASPSRLLLSASAPALAQEKLRVLATLLDPRRFREERRRRPRRGHDPGRTEQRRPCLFAGAGRRQEGRRRQGRHHQRARLRGLDGAAGARRPASKASPVVATKGIKPRKQAAHGHSHGHGHDDTDPHAWQSVANAKIYVANIRDALIAADPAGKAAYEANAAAYLEKLDALDKEVREAVAAIPQERRRIITSHDAFGYFQARLRRRLHRAAGRVDGVGGVRARRRPHHHPDQDGRRSRRCSWRTSPTRG